MIPENQKETDIRPITNPTKLVNVTPISQGAIGLPTGCESVSTSMVLNFYGYPTTSADFVNNYLDKGPKGYDPEYYFIGSPDDPDSFGCYAPAIAKAMNKILDKQLKAEVIKGKTIEYLCNNYIDKGIPVLIWTTINMRDTYLADQWVITTSDDSSRIGNEFTWRNNEHCLVLIGYNDKDYFVNDPWKTPDKVQGAYEKTLLQDKYEQMGTQAVVIKSISS